MATESQAISASVAKLATELTARGLSMATAESCTGGGIAEALTALAGSSAWFDSGFVTYSNEAKQRMLGVDSAHFQAGGVGAVSREVVLEMSRGAVERSAAQAAVAVSGVAGPGGGSEAKPVGTVWIAWCIADEGSAECFTFAGDRDAVRSATIQAALDGLIARLEAQG
jgi:nicotinamide-nucleotide amidase